MGLETLGFGNRRYSVLLIDSQILCAEAVSAMLEESGEFVVTNVASLEAALALIRTPDQFDVVLLDYEIPDGRGLEGLREVIAANGRGVALYSGVGRRAIAVQALENGAAGFIPKTLSFNVLIHAVKLIADGGSFVPFDLMHPLNDAIVGQFVMKPREEKVLVLISEGLANKAIALSAGLTETTVKNDIKSLCKKLGARNRTDLVRTARNAGLI